MLKYLALMALTLALAGCSAQSRIAANTTEILKAVRGAREDLYIIAQEHPEVMPQLKAVSDKLMVAVDAAYDTNTALSDVEDQTPMWLAVPAEIALAIGGAVIVGALVFAAWKSGALSALAAILPSRERK